jgi:hypothetical protein
VNQADLREIFEKASQNVWTSIAVVTPDILSPAPSTSSAMKAPEDTKPDDLESTDKGDN